MRCRFESQNCETLHTKQKWTKSCTIWKYYMCLEPEWAIFRKISPIKWKVNPRKIRSVGFQMYHHINNGDISPNQPENPPHLLTRLGTSRVSKRRVSGSVIRQVWMRTRRPGRGKKSTVAPAVSRPTNIPVPGSPDPHPKKYHETFGKLPKHETSGKNYHIFKAQAMEVCELLDDFFLYQFLEDIFCFQTFRDFQGVDPPHQGSSNL